MLSITILLFDVSVSTPVPPFHMRSVGTTAGAAFVPTIAPACSVAEHARAPAVSLPVDGCPAGDAGVTGGDTVDDPLVSPGATPVLFAGALPPTGASSPPHAVSTTAVHTPANKPRFKLHPFIGFPHLNKRTIYPSSHSMGQSSGNAWLFIHAWPGKYIDLECEASSMRER
ncbi:MULTISPECIES: hypothetical protein [unclassified Burkholderia]|uniref:hypothetical protein n=1 Tax=unclassified Burkholderia TaxID=2613784 RepID=UPI0015D066A6|nr:MULTISPECIES: hypothetical protein [unclassified Burkholderia]